MGWSLSSPLMRLRNRSMAISMYCASIPIFVQFLSALADVLSKSAAYAQEKGIDPSFLLNMRLYPNMYSVIRQVQQATMHADKFCAALAGVPQLHLGNTEKTFADLQIRIARTIAYLKSFDPSQIDGTEDKMLALHEREQLPAQVRLLNVTLPHFYFHCATAYDILRHCGVPLQKRDYMGSRIEFYVSSGIRLSGR
jgi:uncharacterized protein